VLTLEKKFIGKITPLGMDTVAIILNLYVIPIKLLIILKINFEY